MLCGWKGEGVEGVGGGWGSKGVGLWKVLSQPLLSSVPPPSPSYFLQLLPDVKMCTTHNTRHSTFSTWTKHKTQTQFQTQAQIKTQNTNTKLKTQTHTHIHIMGASILHTAPLVCRIFLAHGGEGEYWVKGKVTILDHFLTISDHFLTF